MDVLISVLLIVLGLIVGFVVCYIVLNIKTKNTGKTVEKMLENAKKEAEKVKRESLFEAKEEIHKLKLESEKEIKDRPIIVAKVMKQVADFGLLMKYGDFTCLLPTQLATAEKEEFENLYADSGYYLINVIGTCEKNVWNGNVSAQIIIEDYEIIERIEYDFW